MITSSPSPTLQASAHSSPSVAYSSPSTYDGSLRHSGSQSSIPRSRRAAPASAIASPRAAISAAREGGRGGERGALGTNRQMVDAATQYSPPAASVSNQFETSPGQASIHLRGGAREVLVNSSTGSPIEEPKAPRLAPQMPPTAAPPGSKRSNPNSPIPAPSTPPLEDSRDSSTKRARPPPAATTFLPVHYEDCNPRDLVIVISSMLMELIRFNDTIPLRDGHLTRFHSRAPPGISVQDYLQRLTTHATLSPPILLSMVYYIDRLCALYPAFTISSLTVHRFLITSATVASKGLSDSFWTNKTYARVGGVSLRELALLELEFLWRVEWRIVPKPEVLVDYYRSLVERSQGYEIEPEQVAEEKVTAKADGVPDNEKERG